MPRSDKRDKGFDELDSPKHLMEPGGVNGLATIRGIPVRPETGAKGQVISSQELGIMAEPVAVLMRDAVTIDTAVRLTGATRQTIQKAIVQGYLPALKAGRSTAPYLVRIRDVITYLLDQAKTGRSRRRVEPFQSFLGFQPEVVEWVTRLMDGEPQQGTPFASAIKSVRRGGRNVAPDLVSDEKPDEAEQYQPPVDWEADDPVWQAKLAAYEQKKAAAPGLPSELLPAREEGGAGVTTPPTSERPGGVDRTKLPKWHPLWRRS